MLKPSLLLQLRDYLLLSTKFLFHPFPSDLLAYYGISCFLWGLLLLPYARSFAPLHTKSHSLKVVGKYPSYRKFPPFLFLEEYKPFVFLVGETAAIKRWVVFFSFEATNVYIDLSIYFKKLRKRRTDS